MIQKNRISVIALLKPRLPATFRHFGEAVRKVSDLPVDDKIWVREVVETITALLFVVGTIPVNYQN